MGLSTALSNALTGLTASSRAAQVVSDNVSNAMTEGYARRELQVSSRGLDGFGGGVTIDGVLRVSDPRLVADRREAEANAAFAGERGAGLARLETALGLPGEPGALTTRIGAFESALIEAASRPDARIRQEQAVAEAGRLAEGIRRASDAVQGVRADADARIADTVERLNTALAQVETLNAQILRNTVSQRDSSGLQDQRQRVIDRIAELVPVREVPRENGTVALFSLGGAVLLDGSAQRFGFTATGHVTPGMTEGAPLSGLTLGDHPLAVDSDYSPIAGGRLQALFDLRDRVAPQAQAGLDAFARDLVERFQDPALDTTLGAGDPGLFTDAGAAFDAVDETGLAGRIDLNVAADPARGGAAWRLRDGLGAAAPGPPGDATLLAALKERMAASRTVASGPGAGLDRTVAGLGADVLSDTATRRQGAEADSAFHAARLDALRQEEAAGGVDTDQEMQKLLLIERAYAASSRVVRTVDELFDQLLRI